MTKKFFSKLPINIWALLGAATVLVIVAALFLAPLLFGFHPKSSGQHNAVNELPEKLSSLPYMKEGGLYFYKDGIQTAAGAGMYDPAEEGAAAGADYLMDEASGRVLYIEATEDSALQLYDGAQTRLLGKSVLAFKAPKGFGTVAFVGGDIYGAAGILYLFNEDTTTPIDSGIAPSSLYFTQDGKYLYALKPNAYPKVSNSLMRYDMQGKSTMVLQQCDNLIWVSKDGKSLITGDYSGENVFNCTVYADFCKKSLKITKTYLNNISEDGSVLYVLCDYDVDKQKGTLKAVDLRNLRTKELAKEVTAIHSGALNDTSKGMVYSVSVDEDKALYDIYYAPLKGDTIKLVRNAREEALSNIALNTHTQRGYLLLQSGSADKTTLFEIAWTGGKVTSKVMDSGEIDGMTYYEKPDCITYIKNPQENKAALYMARFGSAPQKLLEDCGVSFDSDYELYTAKIKLSNDGKQLLYFTDYTENAENDSLSQGTLQLLNIVTGEKTTVAPHVCAGYETAPHTDGTLANIYYLTANNSGKFDLYRDDGVTSAIIAEQTDSFAFNYAQ